MPGKNIFLIGFMGCGKSTISRILADKLNLKRIDSDEYIEKRQNMRISAIFEKYGEEYFRDLETDFLQWLGTNKPAVIACGGGMALRPQNARLMNEKGIVVLLAAEPETIYGRVKDGTGRPLLAGNMNVSYIKRLMDDRIVAYKAAATYEVATDGRTPEDIAEEIAKIYGDN